VKLEDLRIFIEVLASLTGIIGVPIVLGILISQVQLRMKKRRAMREQARGFEVKPITGEAPVPRENDRGDEDQ
jgi:hypothetical protein